MQDVLLIIDLQNGVCQTNDQTIDHLSELLLFVNQRIQRYRKEEKPVIFVQHEEETLPYGSKAWQLHPALAYEPTDRLIRKNTPIVFFKQIYKRSYRQTKCVVSNLLVLRRNIALMARSNSRMVWVIKTSCMPKPQRRIQAEDDQQLKSLIGTK